jgi:hypothetical protein
MVLRFAGFAEVAATMMSNRDGEGDCVVGEFGRPQKTEILSCELSRTSVVDHVSSVLRLRSLSFTVKYPKS